MGPTLTPLSILSLLSLAAKPLSPPFPPWHVLLGAPGPCSALPCPPPKKEAPGVCLPAWSPEMLPPLLPAPPRARGAQPGGLQQGTGLAWRGGDCGASGATSGVLSSAPAPTLQQPSLRGGAGGQWMGEGGFWARVLAGRRSGRVWEVICGGRHPGGAVPGRGTEASTRSRRPGWCRT